MNNRAGVLWGAVVVGALVVLGGCVEPVERAPSPTSVPSPSPTAQPLPSPTAAASAATPAPPAATEAMATQLPTASATTEATLTPTPSPTATRPPLPTPTSRPAPTPSPTATPVEMGSPSPTATPFVAGEIPAGLFLKVTNLPEESIVLDSPVSLDGLTNPDAVLSVNGVVVDVDAEGNFTTSLSLKKGANVIEVITSDFQGNQVSAVITMIYVSE